MCRLAIIGAQPEPTASPCTRLDALHGNAISSGDGSNFFSFVSLREHARRERTTGENNVSNPTLKTHGLPGDGEQVIACVGYRHSSAYPHSTPGFTPALMRT